MFFVKVQIQSKYRSGWISGREKWVSRFIVTILSLPANDPASFCVNGS
jgi:hypothetical protein